MKQCTRCKKTFPESYFNWKIFNVKRNPQCKTCTRMYIKSHYYKHKDYYLLKANLRNYKLYTSAHEFIYKYLANHPCVDCGERDILVLEFDHLDKTRKDDDVSRIIRNTGSLKKLIEEIDKCEVRCANCHRKKTSIQNNSWKLFMRS